jgi:hypothetical protein
MTSETSLILEHVQMLLATLEDQGESNAVSVSQLLDEKTAEFAKSLESQIEKRFEKLESQIEKFGEKSIAAQNETVEFLCEFTQASPETAVQQSEHQRELANKLDLVAERFSEKTDTIAGILKSQIEQMIEDLDSRFTDHSQSIGDQPEARFESQDLAPTTDETASHWHQQKEAMLSKYGIDPDYRPLMELQESLEPEVADVEHETAEQTDSIPEADAVVIEELKERLNAKLREAEVELSISRAKIAQQKAELDVEQVELDRRAKMIEEKFAAVEQAPKRMGLFKWLWHHLKPKPRAVNDRV